MSNLPRAIHFITQAPELNIVRFGIAVLFAQFAVVRALIQVAIFQQLHRLCHTASTQIDGHHHIGVGFFRPIREFIQTHFIGFHHAPGQINALGAVFFGTDAIFPFVSGNKIAAGITNHRNTDFLHQFQRILAEALLIRLRMTGLIDALIDGPTQMLNKGAVNAAVNGAEDKILIDGDFRLFHKVYLLKSDEKAGHRGAGDRPPPYPQNGGSFHSTLPAKCLRSRAAILPGKLRRIPPGKRRGVAGHSRD